MSKEENEKFRENLIRWDKWYLDMCDTVAKNSMCLSRKIGAILVRDKSIISQGYNGPPRGVQPCDQRWFNDPKIMKYAGYESRDPKSDGFESFYDVMLKGKCPRYVEDMGFKSGEGLEWCLDGRTKIKLLKGEEKTIQELAENNKEEWIYSIDTKSLEIVPALAKNFRMTGIRNDLVEVLLDDETKFRVTHDHLILLKDGTYKEAGKLEKNDRLMPMYYIFHDGYEMINNYGRVKPDYGSLGNTNAISTENLVFEYFNKDIELKYNDIIHHKDENKRNNTPENLKLETRENHSREHILKRDKEFFAEGGKKCIEKRKEDYSKFIKDCSQGGTKSMKANWENEEFRRKIITIQKQNGSRTAILTNSNKDVIKKRTIGRIVKRISKLIDMSNETVNSKNYEKLCSKYRNGVGKGFGFPSKNVILNYFSDIEEAIEIASINHKVLSITPLSLSIPVYDVEVPIYHNFAIDLGNNTSIFTHNCVAGHAERNTLINAARHGIQTKDAKLYMNCGIPCTPCLVEIINAGIEEIIVTKWSFYDVSAEYILNESGLKCRVYKHLEDVTIDNTKLERIEK